MPLSHASRPEDCPDLGGVAEETPAPPNYLTIVRGGGRPPGDGRGDNAPHANARTGPARQETLVGMSRIWFL